VGFWTVLGVMIVIGLGFLGLLLPRVAASFVHVSPVGKMGLSEIRATYGGVFLGLGATTLLTQNSSLAFGIGVGFACAAVARALSAILEESREPRNLAGITFEGIIAALLLL
jgi:hypothetical protein